MTHFNIWYLGAAIMMVAISAIHAFAGGPEIHQPVQAAALSAEIRATMAVVWHALTGLFLVFAAALAWAAFRDDTAVVYTVLATSLFFVALFIATSLSALGGIVDLPQWTLFLAVAAVLAVGLSRPRLTEALG